MSLEVDNPRLRELLLKWEELQEGGEDVSAEALCTDCPELAGALAQRIEALRAISPLLSPSEGSAGASAPSPGAGERRRDVTRGPATCTSTYRGLTFHAEGGLGEVFLARGEDLPRDVALKFLKSRRLRDPESRQRFVQEAEITGRLEHPGVVPVYGVGADSDGHPCYAMRFIRGRTLDEAIRELHAGDAPGAAPADRLRALRGLVRRLVSACNTVAYAHSRGVLHRDLKPANIMIGPFEETLVLDWGLAKTFGPGAAGDESPTRTGPGESGGATPTVGAVGTPAYMSPEQAEGRWDLVGPASDVYSLGATLYCMLAGVSPRRSPFAGGPGATRRGKAWVPRALEAVCARAMAPEPSGRYPTALDLAADLGRWLDDEPVSAWREPLMTRLARWARRHRAAVLGATAVLAVSVVLLAASTVIIGRKQAETDEARRRAEENFRQAQAAVDRYLKEVGESRLLNVPGLQPLRKDLMAAARGFYQGFVAQRGRDPAVRAELGAAHLGLARIAAEVGARDEAVREYEQARDLFDRLARERPGETKPRLRLAEVHEGLGRLAAAESRMADAESAYRVAVDLAGPVARDHPQDVEAQALLAQGLNDAGRVEAALDRGDRAEASLREALALRERVARDRPGDRRARGDLAETQGHLGNFYARANQTDRAVAMLGEAVATWDALAAERPDDLHCASALANNLVTLGIVHSGLNRLDRAEAPLRRAREIRERLARENPAVTGYRHDLALCVDYLANVYGSTGRTALAEDCYRESRPLWEALVREQPRSADMRHGLAFDVYTEGMLYLNGGRTDRAEPLLEKAREQFNALAADHPERPRYREGAVSADLSLARIYRSTGRRDLAARVYRRALEAVEPIARASPKNPMMQSLRVECALGLASLGDYVGAAAQAEAALTLVEPVGISYYNLACVFSLSRGAALGDERLDRAERDRRADGYAGRAVEMLKKARAVGFFQDPAAVASLQNDPDLAPLHSLASFATLRGEIARERPAQAH